MRDGAPPAPIKMKFYKGDFYYVHTFQNLKGRFPLDQTRVLPQFQCGIQKHSRFLIHFALTLETLHQCLLLLFNPIFVDCANIIVFNKRYMLCCVVLGWAGLSWAVLGWAVLGWVWAWLCCAVLGLVGLCCAVLGWAGLC